MILGAYIYISSFQDWGNELDIPWISLVTLNKSSFCFSLLKQERKIKTFLKVIHSYLQYILPSKQTPNQGNT